MGLHDTLTVHKLCATEKCCFCCGCAPKMCILVYGIFACLGAAGAVMSLLKVLGAANLNLFSLLTYAVFTAGYVGTVVGFLTGYCGKKECGNWLMFYMLLMMAALQVVV